MGKKSYPPHSPHFPHSSSPEAYTMREKSGLGVRIQNESYTLSATSGESESPQRVILIPVSAAGRKPILTSEFFFNNFSFPSWLRFYLIR